MKRIMIGTALVLAAALTAGCAGPSEPEPKPSAPQGSVTLPGGPNVNDPSTTPTPSPTPTPTPGEEDGPGPTPIDEPERRPGGEQPDRQATANAHQVARFLAQAQNWYGEHNQGQYFASLDQLDAFIGYMQSQGYETPGGLVIEKTTDYYILLDVDRVKFDIVAIGADGVVYEAWADGELKYVNYDEYAKSAYTVTGVPKAKR